jgi:predicted MFS family arabinose efflux permease
LIFKVPPFPKEKERASVADQVQERAAIATARRGWLHALEALQDRNFRIYWACNGLFLFGQFFNQLTHQWLVVSMTSSRTLLGMVGTIQGGAGFFVAPFGGVLADRVPRRHILTAARGSLGAIILVLALLVAVDAIEVWHVLIVAFLSGIILAFTQAATQTYVFDLVGAKRLANALALNSGMTSAFQMAGPVMGGFIIALGGVGLSYLTGAGLYFLGVMMMLAIPVLGIPTGSGPEQARRSVISDVVEGFKYARKEPLTLWLIIMTSTTFFNAAHMALRPAFARDILHVGSQGFGLLTTVAGIGSVAGAIAVAAFLKDLKWKGWGLIASLLFKDCLLIVYAFSRSFPLTLAMEALIAVINPFFLTTVMTYLQTSAPPNMRGRVVGLMFTTFQLNQMGALAAGALADATSETFALAGSTLVRIGLLLIVVAVARPLRHMGREPASAQGVS